MAMPRSANGSKASISAPARASRLVDHAGGEQGAAAAELPPPVPRATCTA